MSPGQSSADGPARDPHCLFCSIVEGEVPAQVVATSEHAIAFRDLNPQAPTHVLVIPRHHAATAAETAAAGGLDAVVSLAVQVAKDEELEQGYRMVFNTGPDAGQSVFHTHLHLLGGRQLAWPPG
ncbi:HIT domain-containing protein [Nostocoides sp. F2B08]|uniref:HIT domain-containing protein n=1 Tax=Nostocoides sp. F2B08 TaxID=2653936 RepID=UPI0012636B40|nr:HIT domain-containing protein [Tetrasphaera sp. F2B08]KAB7744750.1 HIT domain-containing protein [Tetrasphaera sp. F2B08]